MSESANEHVVVTPGVCGGKPRIAGHRIRVQDIVLWHDGQGQSPEEIVGRFPQSTYETPGSVPATQMKPLDPSKAIAVRRFPVKNCATPDGFLDNARWCATYRQNPPSQAINCCRNLRQA